MAYSFFPKTGVELSEGIKTFGSVEQGEINSLFHFLKLTTGLESPINIDKMKPRIINVSRSIQSEYTLQQIRSKSNLSKVKIKFGNGSSGNRGINNRGNLFEPQFATAMLDWWGGESVANGSMMSAINDLDQTYNLNESSSLKVDVVGGVNTKRPLIFSPNVKITNPKGSGNDVGKSVTDITLVTDGKKETYLSLKLGGTTTFFNVGVRTILTPTEIKNGDIKNKDGLRLLKLFGIDPFLFTQVFNQEFKESKKIYKITNLDRMGLQLLLESGVGYGYHVIHKMGSKIISKKMDKAAMQAACKPQSLTVYYGGMGGNGRRIDMVLETASYTMKLNIRDTQGLDGYPTRLMCDFKYKN